MKALLLHALPLSGRAWSQVASLLESVPSSGAHGGFSVGSPNG
jgi:hypothetical protein